MQRSFQHSAEGSTWTKKNHKYIRKEGNRYIYPKDLKKGSVSSNSLSARDRADQRTEVEELKRMEAADNRRRAVNNQGTRNYKQLSEQHANREAAKSGMVINPGYTLKDQNGKVFYRGTDKGRFAPADQGDYKRYSKEYADVNPHNARNRYKTTSGSQNIVQRANRKDAANGKIINPTYSLRDSSGKKVASYTARETLNSPTVSDYKQYSKEVSDRDKRKRALNSQNGANSKGYNAQEYAKISAPTGKKRAARLAAAKEARQNRGEVLNKQGVAANGYKGQAYAKLQGKEAIENREREASKRRKEGVMTMNEFMSKNLADKDKKRGYITVKNGKTVYVPSDEITMKKMSKAEKLVNKIKSKFSKKDSKESTKKARSTRNEVKPANGKYVDDMGRTHIPVNETYVYDKKSKKLRKVEKK